MRSLRASRWARLAGRWTRALPLRALLVIGALVLLTPLSRAEDEDPVLDDPLLADGVLEDSGVVLATVSTDPGGDAGVLLGHVRRGLAAEDFEAAFDDLIRLAERHSDVLMPVGAVLANEIDGALRWRAREVANLALARLPEPWQRELVARWGPEAAVLLERGRRGERDAWIRLARDFGALPTGARTLLLLADADLEAGRLAAAARGFERWLLLHPHATDAARALVFARIGDVLLALDDAGGLDRLVVRAEALKDESIVVGGRETTLGAWLARKRRAPDDVPEPGVPALPDALELLWAIDMDDPTWLRPSWDENDRFTGKISAGAWAEEDLLVLHGGRVVRRLDPATGLELWRFPHGDRPPIHAPDVRYLAHDIPHRTVTRAGDVVLCVMGEPGATGSYKFLGEDFDASDVNQELRMRLVALDVETGELKWWTGGADETHPVLGDRSTGCASPPLVVGDKVYCLFARRRGTGEFHLACLDLATGRPEWVRWLASGESGRAEDRTDDERFSATKLQALPWGARPALAGGEILALPHAGFAAGVDAAQGSLDWVRALPRFAYSALFDDLSGHAGVNEVSAWGDAWILAPLDSPRLICLERGSGLMRWHHGHPDAGYAPPWRHLFGVALDPGGRPAVHVVNEAPLLLDVRDPTRPSLNGGDADSLDAPRLMGRGLVLDRVLHRVIGRSLWATSIDVGLDTPQPDSVTLPAEAPFFASVYRAGDVWVLVGRRYAAAVAAPQSNVFAARSGTAPRDRPTETERAQGAVAAAIRARLSDRPERLDAAFDRADAVSDPSLRAAVDTRLAAELGRWLHAVSLDASNPERALGAVEPAQALAALVARLPADLRGPATFHAVKTFVTLQRPTAAVDLLEAWIAEPGDALVAYPPPDPRYVMGSNVRLRGDLAAAAVLQGLRDRPAFQRRLAVREQAQNEQVTAVLDADEGLLRAAIRRAVGTKAATLGRKRLRDRLDDAGRHVEAAAIDADLRLDPSPFARQSPSKRLREIARLQLREAQAIAAAGALDRARSLLIDLARWAPVTTRDRRGRPVAVVLADVEQRQAREPDYMPDPQRLDLWRGLAAPRERNQFSSVQVLPVEGPGAAQLGALVPVSRGLTFELWSRESGERVASLPGTDEGWFGGSLHAVDAWVPGGGILVTSVVAGEPADRSTVRADDWIRSWNGQPVSDLSTFMRAVAAARPGESIDIEVYRDGRQILDRFRAGRRPIEQRANLAYAPLYATSDGRLLLPGRTGLSWVDAKRRTRDGFWTWAEAGVVRRAHVFAGECYVAIQRNLAPDLVLRLDLETGREVWRASVAGSIGRVQAVGSALWVDAVAPQGAFVLDRHDGSVRAHYRAIPVRRPDHRRTWTPTWTSDATPAGRGFVAAVDAVAPRLFCVNTTSGQWEWSERWNADVIRDARGPYLDPFVSADAVYAVVQGAHTLLLGVPDPLGDPPGEGARVVVGPGHLRTDAEHGGQLSADTRVHVKGNSIHVVRNTVGRRVTIWSLQMDFAQPRGTTLTGRERAEPILRMNKTILTDAPPGASPWPYVLHIVPGFDGVYVTAAMLANEPYVEVWYISDLGTDHLLMETVNEARRHPPVRVGEHLYVPTDRGAAVIPLRKIER